ncbi:unnamed protein product [Urochloa decumbens]|uniref:Uncharacterized protein n=1 Tax=Urochloa decumbens TaxID=240449 RepID=A0ABC9BN86_9POAL
MGAHQEGEARDDAHGVDIDSLARQLREELAAANSSAVQVQLTGGCPIIIAEVGSLTRNVDAAEYDPHHVAIGPYHRIRNPDLARDDEKIRCLNAVLSSATASAAAAATTLEVYLDEIAGLEARARSCYAHSFSLESREFVRMLLLDGCYLLVRFGDVGACAARRANGAAAGKCVVPAPAAGGGDMLEAVAVVRDALYLAENQIPFFVLDKIHQRTRSDTTVSAVDAIAGYVHELLRRQQYSVATPALSEPTVPGNLLHLLHMHLVPTVHPPRTSDGNKVSRKRRVGRWKTATEYHLAGVKFKSRPIGGDSRGGARSILDVRLDAGGRTLEIPRLNIDGETWRLLRNLMALEQRNPGTTKSHVTAYCVFVSQLACTASDVEFLARRGVVSHGLGNHGEVAALFSDLCKGVVFCADDPELNYLRGVCQALESGGVRCRRRRWMVWLRRMYFSNPWLVVGLVAGALGLVCTMVQAVYSVLSYRQGGR